MTFNGSIEDRLAIRELIETYADAVTTNDADRWGACWAEDAVWSMPEFSEFPDQHGREAIVAMWKMAMSQFAGVMFAAWPGAIDIDGERANVRSWTSEVYDQDGSTYRDRGRYDDVCRKENGRWVFEKRVFRRIHHHRSPA